MANPYAASTSAGAIMANVRGDLGDDGGPNGRLDENALSTQEVTRRILAYTRPHRVSLVASFLASAVSVVLQLYVPIVVGRAIDCMVAAGDVDFPALVVLLQQLALVQSDGVLRLCADGRFHHLFYRILHFGPGKRIERPRHHGHEEQQLQSCQSIGSFL